MASTPLRESSLPALRRLRRGKVRDVYDVDAQHLLIVATDRISAFDHVLGSAIPDKGKVLTQLSVFWFELLHDLMPHHVVSANVDEYPALLQPYADELRGRSMLVRRAHPLPVECVARGYLAGSGWKDYVATGQVCGVALPPGLRESERLPDPIFTPATKATSGHDENITESHAAGLVGSDVLEQAKAATLTLYRRGVEHAASRGIVVADTKFEFGLVEAGGQQQLILIDEVLTPDSSRFWPAEHHTPGGPQPSFDKQYVRDYLEAIGWNKQPPVPSLPDEVVARTRERYLEAFHRITGGTLA
ncbi:MAG: phosphoribosylaminoimidazolesuccinocarboxamide synthase [Luteitalea sp.]|nr:phosphoribosylaminoimidazolesuccinocarboxamide synthase [Luteitalea sp.]